MPSFVKSKPATGWPNVAASAAASSRRPSRAREKALRSSTSRYTCRTLVPNSSRGKKRPGNSASASAKRPVSARARASLKTSADGSGVSG